MNFIKKIFSGNVDESVHKQLVRFGKGEYKRRALLSLWKTGNVKIKSSFEFANDFVLFAANLADLKFYGPVWSKEEISGMDGKKKEGKWIYTAEGISSREVRDIAPKVYCFLLNADGTGVKLKIKAKLPKPGKGEDKIDEKFCQLELDAKYYKEAKDDFFWDLPECKKASLGHTIVINEIIPPKGEKDYARIRELALRKGKIIREGVIDDKPYKKEIDFQA